MKETRRFLATVPSLSVKSEQLGGRVAVIHGWDHLTQLAEVISKAPKPAWPDAATRLEGPKQTLVELLDEIESRQEQENANPTLDTTRIDRSNWPSFGGGNVWRFLKKQRI